MSAYGDVVTGLKIVLQAGVTGLRCYDYPPDNIQQFPAAVILPEAIDTEIAFGGNSITASLRVVFLTCKGDDAQGFLSLYDFIDPVEANKSVIKAVRDDRTLDGKADNADVTRIENIGRRELWGGWYFGFDAIVEFIKSVA